MAVQASRNNLRRASRAVTDTVHTRLQARPIAGEVRQQGVQIEHAQDLQASEEKSDHHRNKKRQGNPWCYIHRPEPIDIFAVHHVFLMERARDSKTIDKCRQSNTDD